MSTGERDLGALLADLEVIAHPGRWVFETQGTRPDLEHAAMGFREREGWTVIQGARDGEDAFAWLELAVHSSLEAVGFLAAVSTALAKAGIACNAVAAYHHDHIFVPEGRADEAKRVIEGLARGA